MMKISVGAGLSALLVAGLLSFASVGAANAASVMKQCGDDWKAAKAAGTTNGQTWQDFLKTCRAQKEGAATPAPAPAAPAAAAAPAPAPTPTPQPIKPAAAPIKPAPAPIKPAAAPTGAGQFTTEAEAKSRCPSDTVVWVTTNTHKYHYTGDRWYGNTKHGAYMCEADAEAAGDVAAKGKKPKS